MTDNNNVSVESVSEENGKIHVEITHRYSINQVIIGFAIAQMIWGILSSLLNHLLQ